MMSDEQDQPADDLTRVEVSSLGLDKASGTPVVILKETNGERILPIWIGPGEASAIAMVLAGIEFSRPLTHDLLHSVVGEMGGEILRVQIHRVVENTYYASLLLQRAAEVVAVDSRPSDSVALALRASAPIFVLDELLDTMPIEIQQGPEDQASWASSGEDVIPKRDPSPTGGTADPEGLREYLKSLDPEDFGRFEP
jgi:bifunctional DNase/RNase